MDRDAELKRRGQRTSIFIAGVAVFWFLIIKIGEEDEWSQRTRALFDLVVLAGFGVGIWKSIQIWRARQADKE
ncbi:MAG: DUF5337 domain-containing protein [Marivita sp.]|uniref:DUF5337 domain-containing protein n=1 Tax=Marivita sp. TaxID=2003365 RepID=UPI0025C380A9|nr:DUF5337 domain-containing protein [Marivita sp.]MCI5111819.1 DUF5337 domain-containing protein [Marivita sp.]